MIGIGGLCYGIGVGRGLPDRSAVMVVPGMCEVAQVLGVGPDARPRYQ